MAGRSSQGTEHLDPFTAAAAVLAPMLSAAVAALGDTPFTTGQLITRLRRSRGGEPAYQHALAVLAAARPERRKLAEHSLHGIVVPGLLRSMPEVSWVGFAYGGRPDDDDGPDVPAWWRRSPA